MSDHGKQRGGLGAIQLLTPAEIIGLIDVDMRFAGMCVGWMRSYPVCCICSE
jgi:hypothetical protein